MNSDDPRAGLGIALNEAALLGFEVHPDRRVANATFSVLTLPPEGRSPADCRAQLIFWPVGRVTALYRRRREPDAPMQTRPVELDRLLEVVQSFGGLPIYGWEFFDVHEARMEKWPKPASLDWQSGADGRTHSIWVFQEEGDAGDFELCVWFDHLEIRRPTGEVWPIEDFIAGGRRWWDGLHSGDPRTAGHGIFGGKPPLGA